MSRNAIRRVRLRQRRVECPLCSRQIAAPTDHLIAYGAGQATVENADAVECPACAGVTFVVEDSEE